MGISSITSMNSMPVSQTAATGLRDQKSKSIQNEITSTQQQIRKLSSKEDLSANEKTNKQKQLQKEISGLNAELKQYQDELRKSQKREIMMAELQEDQEPAKEEKSEDQIQAVKEASQNPADKKDLPNDNDKPQTERQGAVISQNNDGVVILKDALNQDKSADTNTENKPADASQKEAIDKKEPQNEDDDTAADANLSGREIYATAAADSSLQQADRLGTVVTRTRNGIAILKGEMKQDENLGADTTRKQAELEKMEKQEQRATAFQSSILGEANSAAKSAIETNESVKDSTQDNTKTVANAFNLFPEDQTLQQQFYVSIG